MTCSPRGAVEPRVVQDAVVAGEAAGEDRRVVGERDRRERRHRAPLVRGAHRRSGGRRSAPRPRAAIVVEHVGVRAVEQEPDDVARADRRRGRARRCARRRPGRRGGGRASSGAQPRSSAMVGATSTSRPARGTSPSSRTPLPAITNGARACTTPSEPCSPRWPPWSSQLCAAVCSTQRSGAAGWSKSCAIVVERERVRVGARGRVRVGELGVEADEPVGGLVGERIRRRSPPMRS